MNILLYMKNLEEELANSIKTREAIISKLPEGELKCFKDRGHFSRYRVAFEKADGKATKRVRSRIPAGNIKLAEKLAAKGFHLDALRVERKCLKAVRLFLKYYNPEIPGERYIMQNSEYARLASSQLIKPTIAAEATSEETLKGSRYYTDYELDWMYADHPYERPHCAALTVPTVLDYSVRSKSEAEYVARLAEHHIVFRYEWPLFFNDANWPIFPDFTILNPATGEILILEHIGRIDDDEYMNENTNKIIEYVRNGYLPGKNIFFSYESLSNKFTSLDAEEMIAGSILPQLPSNKDAISRATFWIR